MTDAGTLGPGTLLAGKFRIERLIGAGAMGAVYAIVHEPTHRKRALKLLHPALCNVPDLVRRFLNEASAAGRAGSSHLVETFDAGTLPTGEPYLVMELLDGETLDRILRRERRLDAALATEIVSQAAEGIDAAHRAGIIHRDLKPENLFVTARDGAPFLKILDFGVSKFATTTTTGAMRLTRAGMVYGSPAYMSPEQLQARDVDPRTDVFALGVVLFQALAGVLPFDAPTLEALAVRMLTAQPPPLETLRPDLPAALVGVVRRALATARDDRIPTAKALADALSPFRAPVPLPNSSTLPLAPTMLSPAHAAPVSLLANPMVATPRVTPSVLPGVSQTRRMVYSIGAAAVGAFLAVATGLVVAHSRARATITSSGSTAASRGFGPTGAPPDPSSAFTLTPPLDSLVPSPARLNQEGHTSAAWSPLSPPSASASTSDARTSPAHNLGLSEDNPFR
jgi:serine/threonine protein kinase